MSDSGWLSASAEAFVCGELGALGVSSVSQVQELWGGYGQLLRVELRGAVVPSVIVKLIVPPGEQRHPRGWNTDRSFQRKLRSYEVERAWYTDWSVRCDESCRVPHCYGVSDNDGLLFVLEDLDALGFSLRRGSLSRAEVLLPLRWLAAFHARFMGEVPDGLWPVGSYWHLDTRPDEWEAMTEGPFKSSASAIDEKLQAASFQTLIHGDAKVANFCFVPSMEGVSAVDFQYVGGGCGVKDVAYLLGSCLTEHELEAWSDELVDAYFVSLREALLLRGGGWDLAALETEWRGLLPFAWADFHRFLLGWMPNHRKIHGYSVRMSEVALHALRAS